MTLASCETAQAAISAPVCVRPSTRELLRFFLWLGAAGFGGPIALVGYMERHFVDVKRWITREELKDGIAFSQLAPGPLAAQLAIYLGWLCRGVRGASVVGFAFVAPSFAMVLVIAVVYERFGGLPWLEGAFYGIGAAVIAIIGRSAIKLARSTLGSETLLWVVFAVSGITTAITEAEMVLLFVGGGALVMFVRSPWARADLRTMLIPPLQGIADGISRTAFTGESIAMSGQLFLFFASAGAFVFGSGLAIVPFLHGGVVVEREWLTERQFLDAVAVALITPGPVVITVAFIGYLVAGPIAAVAAAIGVFAPVYVITIWLAPHYDRLKSNAHVRAFVDGVTAAAAGAIAGAAFVLGRRAVIDITTALIALATFMLLITARKIPEPLVILCAGALGVLLKA